MMILGSKICFNIFLLVTFTNLSLQDIYLHNPRGSNNRLNEKSATRTNDNRVFNSQNNERGGYNIGDATNKAFTTEYEQYQMVFNFQKPSFLTQR